MAFYADYYKATSETAANLIYNESDKTPFGEFGDHIGDTDIGQVRYFSRVISMGELLGFDDLEANNPSSPDIGKILFLKLIIYLIEKEQQLLDHLNVLI